MEELINLGGFTNKQWKNKREILKSNLDYSEEWEEAINWYNSRLKNRYFDPMKRIEEYSIGEGFSLATIHCALIEHFASITQGKIFNYKLNHRSPKYEYKFSAKFFQNFLKSSPLFSEFFTSLDDAQPPFDTEDFYANVRCALLHEACTKKGWTINTLSCGYSNPSNKIMIKYDSGIKRLFRDVLTVKLGDFMESYKEELKNNKILRLYFARKMDHLCEIEADSKAYEWWKEI